VPQLHFLNVGEGDCTWIQHVDGKNTVIDVSNGNKKVAKKAEAGLMLQLLEAAEVAKGIKGNFRQKQYPVNPIDYLRSFGVTSIFRFIATHPDMDHLDGIKNLFAAFGPSNFWDTENTKEIEPFDGSKFSEDDWKFYKGLRDGSKLNGITRLTLYSGARGQYYNMGDNGSAGGNGLHILAPTKEMVDDANTNDDFNDCSYVLLYKVGKFNVVIGGDSHDVSWEHILQAHPDVKDVDLLIAPHHGRDSERSYDFLDVLNPKLTLFGVARSEHLGYQAWNVRDLEIMTNNQGNCFVIDFVEEQIDVHCTYKGFAEVYRQDKYKQPTFFDDNLQAWYIKSY